MLPSSLRLLPRFFESGLQLSLVRLPVPPKAEIVLPIHQAHWMFRSLVRRFGKVLPLLVLLLSICLAILLGFTLRRQQQHAAEDIFNELSHRLTGAMKQILRDVHSTTPNLASAMHRQPRLERYSNATFWRLLRRIWFGPSALHLGRGLFPGRLIILEGEDERAEAERRGLNGSSLRSLEVPSSAEEGPRKAPKAERYIVLWDDTLEEAVGCDVGADSGWGRAVQRAMATGQVTSFLVRGFFYSRTSYYLAFAAPITRHPPELYDATNFTGDFRKAAVFALVSIQDALERILQQEGLSRVYAQINARTDDISHFEEAETVGPLITVGEVHQGGKIHLGMERKTTFQVGDTKLIAVFAPTDPWLEKYIWFWSVVVGIPVLVLCYGLVSALLLGIIVYQFRVLDRERGLTENALSSRNKFLAYLCHELRNPLNATKGLLEWLRETVLTQQQEEYVGSLEVGFQHMSRIMNDTLDLGKLEAGRVCLQRVEFDLCEQLLMTVKMLAGAAELKGLQLVVKACRELPRFVFGDPTRLTQIISNLLSNAIKFTMKGNVCLLVRMVDPSSVASSEIKLLGRKLLPLGKEQGILVKHGRLKPWPLQEYEPTTSPEAARRSPIAPKRVTTTELRSGVVEIQVLDTGRGICPESLPNLFLPYSQPIPTVEGTGTGLGLSFVKGLVCCWGGEVTVKSQPGVGTAFIIRLPVWFREGQPRDDCLAQALEGRICKMSQLRTAVVVPGIYDSPNARNRALQPRGPPDTVPKIVSIYRQHATATTTASVSPTERTGVVVRASTPVRTAQCTVDEKGESTREARLALEREQNEQGRRRTPILLPYLPGDVTADAESEDKRQPRATEGSSPAFSTLSAPLVTTDPPPLPSLASAARPGHLSVDIADMVARRVRERARDAKDTASDSQEGSTKARRTSASLSPQRRCKSLTQLTELKARTEPRPGVLIVDDTAINRSIVSRKLQRLGYTTLTASNGREAIDVVNADPSAIQLILMDLQMPVMDGHEAARELRQQGCQIPIIALTGSVTDEERQRCRRSGMRGFLPKPLQNDQLTAVLERFAPQTESAI